MIKEYWLNIVVTNFKHYGEHPHLEDTGALTEKEAVDEWDSLNRGWGVIHTLHVKKEGNKWKVEILEESDMEEIYKSYYTTYGKSTWGEV